MQLFDCTAGFGPYRTRVFRFASTAQQLLDEMDFCGIERALVYHTAQRFDVPTAGNALLLREIAGHERLFPSWTILPSHTGEQMDVEDLLSAMHRQGVRALRLFPEDHRYFLDEVSWGDQMAAYMERHIPLFVRAHLGLISDLLRSFPRLVVVTSTQGTNPLDRYAWPLIERYPNLHFETSGYLVDGIIEEFCHRFGAERLIYGSGFPDQPSGAALLMLAQADISESQREAIAAGNLERLLAEAVLE